MDGFAQPDEAIDAVRGRLLSELDTRAAGCRTGGAQRGERHRRSVRRTVREPSQATPASSFRGRRCARALTRRERLDAEKEALGLYLTGHPLDDYLARDPRVLSDPNRRSQSRTRQSGGCGSRRVDAGRCAADAVKRWRSPCSTIAAAASNCRSSPTFTNQHKAKIFKDAVLVVEGEVQPDEYTGALKMRVAQIHTMDEARRRFADCLQIEVSGDGMSRDFARRLKTLLEPHRQDGCPVAISYRSQTAEGRLVLGADWRVRRAMRCLQSLRTEFGAGQVGLHYRRSARDRARSRSTQRLRAMLDGAHAAAIVIGFSGGLDSTVLLHARGAGACRRSRLLALHVNHGLNPHAALWQRHCQTVSAALDRVRLHRACGSNRARWHRSGRARARYDRVSRSCSTRATCCGSDTISTIRPRRCCGACCAAAAAPRSRHAGCGAGSAVATWCVPCSRAARRSRGVGA